MKYNISKSTAPEMPTLGKGTECLQILLSQVSKSMHEPLIPMLLPPLGAHISGAEFQYPDLTWKEMCGQMAHLVAESGGNKGQLSPAKWRVTRTKWRVMHTKWRVTRTKWPMTASSYSNRLFHLLLQSAFDIGIDGHACLCGQHGYLPVDSRSKAHIQHARITLVGLYALVFTISQIVHGLVESGLSSSVTLGGVTHYGCARKRKLYIEKA